MSKELKFWLLFAGGIGVILILANVAVALVKVLVGA